MSTSSQINWGQTGTEPDQITHDLLPHVAPNAATRPGTLDESFAAYVATPANAEEISDEVDPDPGVLRMLWRTRSVVNNVGFSLKDIVDNQNRPQDA